MPAGGGQPVAAAGGGSHLGLPPGAPNAQQWDGEEQTNPGTAELERERSAVARFAPQVTEVTVDRGGAEMFTTAVVPLEDTRGALPATMNTQQSATQARYAVCLS